MDSQKQLFETSGIYFPLSGGEALQLSEDGGQYVLKRVKLLPSPHLHTLGELWINDPQTGPKVLPIPRLPRSLKHQQGPQ